MTKDELLIVCKTLTQRIRELETKAPPEAPNQAYLDRIAEAFTGLRESDKNMITRKACIEAIQAKSNNKPFR